MDFIPLNQILKNHTHRYYKIYYLSDLYGEWKTYRQQFWDRAAADTKAAKMRKNKRYQAVAVTIVNETILDK